MQTGFCANYFMLDVMEMDRHVQLVAVVLLAVIVVGGLLLWAIRKKASVWADQYDKAAANEALGVEADYPTIGYRARRISWRETCFLIAVLAVVTAVAVFFQ